LVSYLPHTHKHTHTHARACTGGQRQPSQSCYVLKAHTHTETGKSTHISTNHSCFPVSLMPSCPLHKFQGRPVKVHSSIKTMMLPDFLYGGLGNGTHTHREGGKRLGILHVCFSPCPRLIRCDFPRCAFSSLAPLASSPHIHVIWREKRDRGLEGWWVEGEKAVLFSLHFIVQ